MWPRAKGAYQVLYGHNYYDMGTPGGFPCRVRLVGGNWTSCGGYQPWMDHYVSPMSTCLTFRLCCMYSAPGSLNCGSKSRICTVSLFTACDRLVALWLICVGPQVLGATHLVMVAPPDSRIASMYYYESGYTKQKDRAPGELGYRRIAEQPRFEDPANADRPAIQKFLSPREYFSKWDRVQWWWIRDATANRTIGEAIALLRKKFVVGLTHRLDETLLIWKRALRLETREIIYVSMKAGLPHPKLRQWHRDEQRLAAELVHNSSDGLYFDAAAKQFERQVEAYGRKELAVDLDLFRGLRAQLAELCPEFAVLTEQLHVPDGVYCMLKHYDAAHSKVYPLDKYRQGCYSRAQRDGGERYKQAIMSSSMTVQMCLRKCRSEWSKSSTRSFKSFGITSGSHCYCSPGEPDQNFMAELAKCNVPCMGDPNNMCGGYGHYSIYEIPRRGKLYKDPIMHPRHLAAF